MSEGGYDRRSREGPGKYKNTVDDARVVLNQYIKHYENLRRGEIKGSGMRRKRGGIVMFFNNPKQLLKTL